MKLILILLLISSSLLAQESNWQKRWWGVTQFTDIFPGYTEGKDISHPEGSVQSIIGLISYALDMKPYKDCLAYEVPFKGEMGILFIVKTHLTTPCEEVVITGRREDASPAKSFSLKIKEKTLELHFTDKRFRSHQVNLQLPSLQQKRAGEKFQSFVQKKWGRAVMILTPNSEAESINYRGNLKDEWGQKNLFLCQNVSDDCDVSTSECDKCRYGFFQVPNGCLQGGPKYCGVDQCGRKGMPACQRGFVYQNQTMEKMDCRLDTSFAFCRRGLRVRCQGSLAVCD